MTGKIEQDREPTSVEQWRDRTLMATDPVEATYWLTHVADAFAVHWDASEPLSTCNEWQQAFRYVVKLYVDAEIAALTRRVDEEREAKHKVMAEAWALTRRNAELTAALGDAEDAWIDSDVHPRDAAGTCEHCDRIAAIFAALTPTESEATNDE